MEEPGIWLGPAPGPDDTDTHTGTHTQYAGAGLAVLTQTRQPEKARKPQGPEAPASTPRPPLTEEALLQDLVRRLWQWWACLRGRYGSLSRDRRRWWEREDP